MWALVTLVVLAGCLGEAPPTPETVIDGFPIGAPVDCAAIVGAQHDCDDYVGLARGALRNRLPGSPLNMPEVVSATVFGEDLRGLCPPGQCTRSGSFYIVVFELADGSRHAAGGYCSVGPFSCVGVETYGGRVD